MEYGPDSFKEFARRTLANLKHMEAQKAKGVDVYEVTQLINSLLGLVTFPYERERIPNTPLRELNEHNWPPDEVLFGRALTINGKTGEPVSTLAGLVEGLRHAVSHAMVSFTTDNRRPPEITHVTFRNTGRLKWELVLSIDHLRKLVTCLAEEIRNSPDDLNVVNGPLE